MNIENAIKQLTLGKPWADIGKQRCGIMYRTFTDRPVSVFEITFPFLSAIENLTEEHLKDIADISRKEMLNIIEAL